MSISSLFDLNNVESFEDKENKKKNKEFSYIPFLRNIGIIAHIDSGKTTCTERILILTGKIHKTGEVHEGTTQTDFLELERERGITIQSAAVTVEWQHSRQKEKKIHKINIIDTPGHLDFKSEVERSLRILDGAVVIMDGKEGVEPQTETVWKQANKYKIPRIVFVNKMDSVENEKRFYQCVSDMKEILKSKPLIVQVPIGAGKSFKGVVDVISKKAFFFKFDDKEEKYSCLEIPDYLSEKVNEARRELIESVVDYDEKLGTKYLNDGLLEEDEIRFLLRKSTVSGDYFPVFCGSAYRDVGVNLLLDGVLDFLPSPQDIPAVPIYYLEDEKKSKEKKNPISKVSFLDPISYLALAFKIVVKDQGSVLTFIRVYAGQITSNSFIYNSSKNKEERVSVLVKIMADKETRIDVVRSGEIAAIKGLKFTTTGDTFSSIGDKKKPIILDPISFDEPVISKAFVPKNIKDVEKVVDSLRKMCVEDPSLSFLKDNKTGQLIVRGSGELHLEIAEKSLEKRFGLEVVSESPKISYKETITKTLKTTTRYKKQTGGHGHFAEITVFFEPNPNKGFEFLNKIRGDSVPRNFAEAVGKGMEEAFSGGLLLGYQIVDVKVSLLDGITHIVDSTDKDFKTAAIICCRENSKDLGLTLLEPIVQLNVSVPKKFMGDVLANLTSTRMVIEGTEEEEDNIKIFGKAPLEKMLGYATTLRELTKGRGNYNMSHSHYQEVPKETLQRMIKEKNE